jgi:hypothetical protein
MFFHRDTAQPAVAEFEVPEANPGADGTCSDNECPCGFPGARIPRGTGYLYISQAVVDFRRDARTVTEAEQKIRRLQQRAAGEGGGFVVFGQDTVAATLMCEEGARRRGLDLEVAAADARRWWATGRAPLRPTPLAGTPEAARERERLGLVPAAR